MWEALFISNDSKEEVHSVSVQFKAKDFDTAVARAKELFADIPHLVLNSCEGIADTE